MNELTIKTANLVVTQGSITFENFEEIYNQAHELKEYIESVEVTEDTMKATKKMLAAVNKKIKELDDQRIEVKKVMLSPYLELENMVKQITLTVKEAEQEVRRKVKELEELEREEKAKVITELFQKRSNLYPSLTLFTVDDFITPKHLNKTTSLNAVEEELATWFEARKRDIELIDTMKDSVEILAEYKVCMDLSIAMNQVKLRKETQKLVEQARTTPAAKPSKFVFTVKSEKDANFIELFLKQNEIKYTLEKGN